MQKEQIFLPSIITVGELAKKMQKPVGEVIKVLLDNGFLANINETLDFETAALIADQFELEAKKEDLQEKSLNVITPEQLTIILKQEKEGKEPLTRRPPIVTILGHVNHGKTTLLDTIRKTKIAEGESGGITQHITAYQTTTNKRLITFIDTPGHEAFGQMRTRGVEIADIAILIVAADDGVKPQTKEALLSLQTNKTPIIVAINKVDKPGVKSEKTKNQLAKLGILLEGRGGDTPCVEISAKNNLNIDTLLETIILLADIIQIEANEKRKALGIVLESYLDKGKGPITTIIIKTGTLNKKDAVVAGETLGTVRQILDFKGNEINQALPGTPVTIIGMSKICSAGSVFQVEESKNIAKIKTKKQALELLKDASMKKAQVKRIGENEKTKKNPKVNLVIRADTKGSLEAIEQIISTLPSDQIELNLLSSKVGDISETDIQLAKISDALVYGFKVKIPEKLKRISEKNHLKIKIMDVIYSITEDIRNEMSQRLKPEIVRLDLGKIKILGIFRTEKEKMIVGGRVIQGKIQKNAFFEIVKKEKIIGLGKIIELKKGQDHIEEVGEGTECGLTYIPTKKEKIQKIELEDILQVYIEEKRKRTL